MKTQEMKVVYFSGVSENTHRFVKKLNVDSERIPLRRTEPDLNVDFPFLLILPTYGFGEPEKTVPKQVIRFLNNPENRKHIVGVIGAGNTNFNTDYCRAAQVISEKCEVPWLYNFEILGTPEDVEKVQQLIETMKEGQNENVFTA